LVTERRGRPVNSITGTNRAPMAKLISLRSRSTARRQPARENLSRAVAS